jgi:hypothetical protein
MMGGQHPPPPPIPDRDLPPSWHDKDLFWIFFGENGYQLVVGGTTIVEHGSVALELVAIMRDISVGEVLTLTC